jgi:hypothetical protein
MYKIIQTQKIYKEVGMLQFLTSFFTIFPI